MSRFSFLPILATVLFTFAASCAEGRDRTADVDRLASFLEVEQSYSNSARQQVAEALPDLRARASEMSEAEFFLAVARQVARADNGHTNVVPRSVRQRFDVLPIRVYWFSDGPHVVRAREDHKDLLGSRIVAIAGRPVEEVEGRMKAFHGGTPEHFRAYFARVLLMAPELLHAEGLAPEPDRLELTLLGTDGEQKIVVLEADPKTPRLELGAPWRLLHPAPLRGEGDGWRTLASAVEPVPLHLDEPGEAFRYQRLEVQNGQRVGYLQLRSNHSHGRRSVRDFLDGLRETVFGSTVAEADLDGLVLDMRQNPGGDLSRSANFLLDLPDLLAPDGRIFVLTGNATFSAGIYSSYFPKSAAPDRTWIVGERVGDRERFWAESGKTFILSEGYVLTTSLQVHDIGAGCLDAAICHMVRYPEPWNLAIGSLEPDIPVATTFADYVARRDPPLERVLELLAEDE